MKYNRRRADSGWTPAEKNYLRFTALEDGSFSFTPYFAGKIQPGSSTTIQYSLDEGHHWLYAAATVGIPVTTGQSVIWKQLAADVPTNNKTIGTFSATCAFNISGCIASLIDCNGDFENIETVPCVNLFSGLFKNTPVVSVNDLTLIFNSSAGCYKEMFKGCTSLTNMPMFWIGNTAPVCYAYMFEGCTSLAQNVYIYCNNEAIGENCYNFMFKGCESITNVVISCPIAGNESFAYMFEDCTSLQTAQVSINTLDSGCCASMFRGCTNLTSVTPLVAETLVEGCYCDMFEGCTSLTVSPMIRAKHLPSNESAQCCAGMFNGCTSLSTIYCFVEDNITDNSNNFENWVDNVAATGTFYKPNSVTWPTRASGIPNGWEIEDSDNLISPLTIESLSDNNTISVGYVTTRFSYSIDNGITWLPASSYSSTPWTIVLNTGDKLLLISDNFLNGKIKSSDTYKVYGNARSLINSISFINSLGTIVTSKYLRGLFKDSTKLVDASGLIIPKGDQNALCMEMFSGCTSLVAAPKLPHDVLAYNCYNQMFKNCTSLTTAPELPSKTLMASCYKSMFEGCTKLTTAPVLPAIQLVDNCYEQMFKGCKLLNYIKCLATDISATNCTSNWLNNVAASGTFVKDETMTSWSTGTSGIPSGWTVQDEDE